MVVYMSGGVIGFLPCLIESDSVCEVFVTRNEFKYIVAFH